MPRFLVFFLAAFLTSCGGGGGSSNDAEQEQQEPEESESLSSGGSPTDPTAITLDQEYSFSDNSFHNYFRYSAVAGEKLIIHAELNSPLSDIEKSRCGASPGSGSTASSYDTQIHVYDSSIERIDGVCGSNLIFDVPTDGVYLVRPDYQSTNSGSIFFSSVIGNSSITSPYGQSGQPSNPTPINFSLNNALSSNTFFNYFTFTASAGQKLIVSTILDTPLSDTQKSRCSANPGNGSKPSSYDTQIHVYDDRLNRVDGICGEDLEFTVPSNGSYILHFSFAQQSVGYFNAALVN